MNHSEIRVLMLEDVPADAELIDYHLRRGGLNVRSKRVVTREEFLRALDLDAPDVILSDHGSPAYTGMTALSEARKKCPSIPFIFVTGAPEAGTGSQLSEGGATDCVLKHQLENLVPTVQRALREAGERAKRKEAEEECRRLIEELRQERARTRALHGMLHICATCKRVRDEKGAWKQIESYLREHSGLSFSHGLCPECAQVLYPDFPISDK